MMRRIEDEIKCQIEENKVDELRDEIRCEGLICRRHRGLLTV